MISTNLKQGRITSKGSLINKISQTCSKYVSNGKAESLVCVTSFFIHWYFESKFNKTRNLKC